MFWILINAFFFILNLVLAVHAETVGWAAFSGFFAGTSFVLMIVGLIEYAYNGDLW